MENHHATLSYVEGESNVYRNPHQHNNRCFSFIVVVHVNQGDYYCYHDGKTIVAHENETLVVPEYILHNIEMKSQGNLSWAHIRAHDNGSDILSGIHYPFILGIDISNELKPEVDRLAHLYNEEHPLNVLHEQMYISRLLIAIVQNHEEGIHSDSLWIRQIKTYVTENISKKLSIKELATQCCMSESTFCHKFKEEVNISPIKYIMLQKINQSLPMLSDHVPLRTISEKLNFSNEYYFSKQFKKFTGMTPTEYAKNRNIT